MYYLNSRYYDPETGRFINSDTTEVLDNAKDDIGGLNLYAYCDNNPVSCRDDDGNMSFWKKLAIAVAVVVAVTGAVSGAVTGAVQGAVEGYQENGWDGVLSGMGRGALKGAVQGAQDGLLSGMVMGGIGGAMNPSFCFVAGTAVLTAAGHRAIEDIKIGDLIPCVDHITGERAEKRVVSTSVNQTDTLVDLVIGGEALRCTTTHPFQVKDKGWVDAGKLQVGDLIYDKDWNTVPVEKIEIITLAEPVGVFNFEVEDAHTYFVGDRHILVHNAPCNNVGRSGKQARLRELANDDKLSSALRGEIKRDINMIKRGQRKTIRVPKGYNLAHRIGYSAKNGYSYAHSDLMTIADHLLQHHYMGK